jgi:uncharacterized protein (TIGR00290 family)
VPRKVLLSWSSGKDSAWALHLLRQQSDIEIAGLFTTFNGEANRVAMHAVRRSLVEAQAALTGLPLWSVDLPWPCSNAQYEELMGGVCARAVEQGIEAFAFGDLFLEDIRAYRERQLQGTGLKPLFPVWGKPTAALAREMIAAGVKAKVTCVDPSLGRAFAGHDFDLEFLASLPQSADPCGENGEFHTFVYESPVFSKPLAVRSGEIVERDGFIFADVVSADVPPTDVSASEPS